jgi:hypothetical protein
MTGKTIPMDTDQAATFAEACGSITTSALNGLSEAARANIAAQIEKGGVELYLHVQMLPEYIVVLALAGDPSKPPLELARWSGAAPEAIKRVLN